MRSLKGFLPTPAFVMAKKTLKNSKAGASTQISAEVPAFFMFVMETPPAHQAEAEILFTKMVEAMGLKRSEIVVANEVKNLIALKTQIKLTNPKVLIALGEAAAKILLGKDTPIAELRGKIHDHDGTQLVATFHPAFLLQNAPAKKDCWDDLKSAMKVAGWKP